MSVGYGAGRPSSTLQIRDRGKEEDLLGRALRLVDGEKPFPWQRALLGRFMQGEVPRRADIPTGLGKTGVMAIWLVARALGAKVPRRMVYVVDRRAVVDQATQVAVGLRQFVDDEPGFKEFFGLKGRSLPISTLRGQHVDKREWLDDPTSPAIIVGTVDMVGSRLLFAGYGVSRKMRPYHAGFLGADALVVLDEAHLVPPFERLLEAIADCGDEFGPNQEDFRSLIPPFKMMALSATGRTKTGAVTLDETDLKDPVVMRRINATKLLEVSDLPAGKKLPEELANKAWDLTGAGTAPPRVIIYCDRRRDAEAVLGAIQKLAKGSKTEVDVELFVGARRVREREEAVNWLQEHGFLAGHETSLDRPAFLIATSAGEVGVDLDAQHMVSDLVAWERMVQRLGRVNRMGNGRANVIIVAEAPGDETTAGATARKSSGKASKKAEALAGKDDRFQATRRVLDCLPQKDGARDGSPGALRTLTQKRVHDPVLAELLKEATTPAPLRPALTRPIVDAWSMTSLEHHTGRPAIGPWLRGWIENDRPQTSVVWRTHLPVRRAGTARVYVPKKEIEAFFEAAPPHLSEVLETETFRVVEWLQKRGKKLRQGEPETFAILDADTERAAEVSTLRDDDAVAVLLSPAGDLLDVVEVWQLSSEEKTKELSETLKGATVVLDARLAGLGKGLLDEDSERPPRTADDGQEWMGTEAEPVVRFRVRSSGSEETDHPHKRWRERFRFALRVTEEGEPGWLIVEKWSQDAATEDDRAVSRAQLLAQHASWAEEKARAIANQLNLPTEYSEMLGVSAYLHDGGKESPQWQKAFNAPTDGVYAKTRGPIAYSVLNGYRHELGSLLSAQTDERIQALSEDLRDLALHLISAHHGYARPAVPENGFNDARPSGTSPRAREIALRFARLQKQWGPWGLAWWESLLRAADQQASRENDAPDSGRGSGVSDD